MRADEQLQLIITMNIIIFAQGTYSLSRFNEFFHKQNPFIPRPHSFSFNIREF